MRLRRSEPQRPLGESGNPLIEIGFAQTPPYGSIPIARLAPGTTSEDARAVRVWLDAVRNQGINDHFIATDPRVRP